MSIFIKVVPFVPPTEEAHVHEYLEHRIYVNVTPPPWESSPEYVQVSTQRLCLICKRRSPEA